MSTINLKHHSIIQQLLEQTAKYQHKITGYLYSVQMVLAAFLYMVMLQKVAFNRNYILKIKNAIKKKCKDIAKGKGIILYIMQGFASYGQIYLKKRKIQILSGILTCATKYIGF